jgi:hypothetical protein
MLERFKCTIRLAADIVDLYLRNLALQLLHLKRS